MAITLRSKGGLFYVRDGKGLDSPMRKVGPDPVFFETLTREQIADDFELEIVEEIAQEISAEKPKLSNAELVRAGRRSRQA